MTAIALYNRTAARLAISLMIALVCCACSPGATDGTGLGFDYASNSGEAARLPLHRLPPLNGDFTQQTRAIGQFLGQAGMAQRSAEQTALNLPFELRADPTQPYRGKFLLFHGLNDSPYAWRDLALELAARGFDIRAILFEGHGSTPRAMLDVSHRDWIRTAREHFDLWREPDVPMYLGGFSMGAVIASLIALETPDIDGMLLISPAFHSRLNHYLRWSGIYAKFKPWVFGGMILEDNPTKYNSIPVNSGWQFFRLTSRLKHRWQRRTLNMPVLMVATQYDSVVDTDYTRRVFRKRFTHPRRRLITYHASPLPQGNEFEYYRDIADRQARLINQSHLGIMYRPDNALFGRAGRVLVCNGNEYPIFMACMRARGHWFGAQHTPSPDGTPVARTTYNPDFYQLLGDLEEVFDLRLAPTTPKTTLR
jgi:alpha-beta hydrolase superfamily lysophospholipase